MSERIVKMIDEKDIDERIREIADSINEEFKGQSVFIVCVLRGAVFFVKHQKWLPLVCDNRFISCILIFLMIYFFQVMKNERYTCFCRCE